MIDTFHEQKTVSAQVNYGAFPRESLVTSYETISTISRASRKIHFEAGMTQNTTAGSSRMRDRLSQAVFWSSGLAFVFGTIAIFMH